MKSLKLAVSSIGFVCQELTNLALTNPDKAYRINPEEWSGKRSLPANAVTHVWYPVIAEYIGSDAKTVKARCKIDFGIPILLNSNNEYRVVLSYILEKTDFWKMTYEQQEKMIQGIAVTSKMNTKECNRYRDNIQSYYNQHGLSLEYL